MRRYVFVVHLRGLKYFMGSGNRMKGSQLKPVESLIKEEISRGDSHLKHPSLIPAGSFTFSIKALIEPTFESEKD